MQSNPKYLDKYYTGKEVTHHTCRKINLYYWFRIKHSTWFYRDAGAMHEAAGGRLRRR